MVLSVFIKQTVVKNVNRGWFQGIKENTKVYLFAYIVLLFVFGE